MRDDQPQTALENGFYIKSEMMNQAGRLPDYTVRADIQRWLVENQIEFSCSSPIAYPIKHVGLIEEVYTFHWYIHFNSADDAILFKLRWL